MTFSLSALFIGLIILSAGACCVVLYQKIAENLAHGVADYDRVKLFGVIAILLGLIVMMNLHNVLLGALVDLMFPR